MMQKHNTKNEESKRNWRKPNETDGQFILMCLWNMCPNKSEDYTPIIIVNIRNPQICAMTQRLILNEFLRLFHECKRIGKLSSD